MAEFPEKIGNYKITAVIAKGGMGTVYKAIHPSLKRYVVIKKLTMRANPALIERFKREAQIMLELQHPNIVHMFDFFKEGPFYYIVLEYVDGMALDKLLKKRSFLSEPIAMLILRDTSIALSHAHEKGVIHRDIKPGNILLSSHGEVKLADFGIASTEKARENESNNLTQDGSALGTPSYMPPEQFSDSKTVDKTADIYALGVMLYEMTTGKKPFNGGFTTENLEKIQKGRYENPKKIKPNLDSKVASLIKKMIQPKKNRRIQSAEKITKICDKYLEKYDCDQLRKILTAELIKEKAFKEPKLKVRKSSARFYALPLCVILAIVGASLLWHFGYIQASILRKIYTPVTVSVTLPKSARGNADLPVRLFVFDGEKAEVPEIPGSNRTLISQKIVNAQGQKVPSNKYSSRPVYLKHGLYRMKVVTGSYVWWQTLQVSSEAQQINLDFLKNERRTISAFTSSYDSLTKKDLTEQTEFLFLNNRGEFVPCEMLKAQEFTNGRIWKIKVICPGYKTEVFDFRIEWYQDELYLNVALEKK